MFAARTYKGTELAENKTGSVPLLDLTGLWLRGRMKTRKLMVKRIIFTALLIIIGVSSFYIGLKPFGPVLAWQDRNSETETETESKTGKSIQKSLTGKSEQILTVWAAVRSVYGAVNVLQSAEAKVVFVAVEPLESLAPFDKTLNRLSNLFLFAYSVLIFEKILLSVFISIAFFILIPVCVIVSISAIWKNKNALSQSSLNSVSRAHRIVIAAVLISLVIVFSLPVTLGVSVLLEEKILSDNVSSLVSSMDENEKNALKMESELRGLRRIGVTITNYILTAKNICNAVIKDTINYLMFFMISNILIPVLAIFGLYKITKYSVKMIL